jgi:hypothetical protein
MSTQDFISENVLDLVFRRRAKVPTNEGGWQWGAVTALPIQQGRFVQSGRVGAAGMRNTPAGRLRDVTATILMMPGSDVQIGDLVDIPAHGIGGDVGIVGEWEVSDISGRWAMNVEVFKHEQ